MALGVTPAHESLDHFGLGHRPAEFGEHSHVDLYSDALGVDDHTVAIKDHERDRAH